MALDTTPTIGDEQGQRPMQASYMQRMQFDGDSSYPTGGTLEFAETYLLAHLGRQCTVLDVQGYGYSAANVLTHVVRYIASTDALMVYVLATGAQVANTTNLSTTTFDVVVTYR